MNIDTKPFYTLREVQLRSVRGHPGTSPLEAGLSPRCTLGVLEKLSSVFASYRDIHRYQKGNWQCDGTYIGESRKGYTGQNLELDRSA